MNFEVNISDRPLWNENYFTNFYEENRIIRLEKDTIYVADKNGVSTIDLPNEIRESYKSQELSYSEFSLFKSAKSYGVLTNEKAYLLSTNFSKIEKIFNIENEFKRDSYKNGIRALIPKFSGYSSVANEVPFVFSNYGLVQELVYYSILSFDTDNFTAKWKYQTVDLIPLMLDRKLIFYLSLNLDKIFAVSPGKSIRYYTYPNYSVMELNNQTTDFETILKPETKSFIRMISPAEIVITPYDFQKGKRKTNNEQIYDLQSSNYIDFSLPKELKQFRILGKVKNILWLISFKENKIVNTNIQ